MTTNLIGRYHTDKSNLLGEGLHLVIATRRNPHPTKPRHYLLERIIPPPVDGPDHRYISGLFPPQNAPVSPTDAQIWHFDYKGCRYTLQINPSGIAEIRPGWDACPDPSNSTNPINNVELVQKFYTNQPAPTLPDPSSSGRADRGAGAGAAPKAGTRNPAGHKPQAKASENIKNQSDAGI